MGVMRMRFVAIAVLFVAVALPRPKLP